MSDAIREQRVRLVQERKVLYLPEETLDCSGAVTACARKVLGSEPREHFLAFAVNSAAKITGMFRVASGGLGAVPIDARTIMQYALVANAAALILAHNHPSGNPEPSDADRKTTARIKTACEAVGVELMDHVIVTPFGGASYSFAGRGEL